MKYIIMFSFLFLGISFNAQAQSDAIEKYFEKYVDDERFTVVYISGKMFSMISKIAPEDIVDDPEAEAALEVAKDIKGLKILTSDEVGPELYKEAIGLINTKEYETLMTVRDGGENVRFLVKDTGDIINELLLLVGGEENFVLLSFVGNIDLNKISKLANQIDIDGAEHLEKLEDDNN